MEAFPDRVIASPLLVTLYKSRRLGRKAGLGFFRYADHRSEGQPDPQVETIIAQWARSPKPFTQEQITARLLLPMVLEATRLLEEGKVSEPQTIDLAMVHGLGFPASRGGLLHWADTLGARQILERLKPLESLGARGLPTQLLLDMAAEGERSIPLPKRSAKRPDRVRANCTTNPGRPPHRTAFCFCSTSTSKLFKNARMSCSAASRRVVVVWLPTG